MGLEQLNKLSAKTVALSSSGGRSSGDVITGSDVAGALGLGRLSNHASLYCQLKYQYDYRARRPLERGVYVGPLLDLAVKEDWRGRAGTLPRMVNLAVDEMLADSLCNTCKGTGLAINPAGKRDECPACNGNGRRGYTDSYRARCLAMDRKNFERIWRDRYYDLLAMFDQFEKDIVEAVNKLG